MTTRTHTWHRPKPVRIWSLPDSHSTLMSSVFGHLVHSSSAPFTSHSIRQFGHIRTTSPWTLRLSSVLSGGCWTSGSSSVLSGGSWTFGSSSVLSGGSGVASGVWAGGHEHGDVLHAAHQSRPLDCLRQLGYWGHTAGPWHVALP